MKSNDGWSDWSRELLDLRANFRADFKHDKYGYNGNRLI